MKKIILLALIVSCYSLVQGTAKVEKAIAYHQPDRLHELGPADLAQLVENKAEYLAKAKESTDKAWEALRARFDFKDLCRILFGSGMLGLGLGALYVTYVQHIKPYLLVEEVEQPASQPDMTEDPTQTAGQEEVKKVANQKSFSFTDTNGIFTLIGSTVGGFLTSMGALNVQKGLTKHDRFMRYYKALAVESNLQRWLTFFKARTKAAQEENDVKVQEAQPFEKN